MKKTQKNCLFKNIITIKSATKATLFPNFNHMGGTNKTIIATAFSAVIAITSPVNANASNNPKQDKIICEVKSICQQLSKSIQAQIDELKAKGLGNLTNDEFAKFVSLKKQVIAVKKSETKHNKNLITTENQKQEQQRKTIDAIDETDKKIAELRGVLLYK